MKFEDQLNVKESLYSYWILVFIGGMKINIMPKVSAFTHY